MNATSEILTKLNKVIAQRNALLEACIEALTLFDNHPECYQEMGTLEVLKAAIEKGSKV